MRLVDVAGHAVVRRTWKASGDVNMMPLTAAVLNLFTNSLIYDGLIGDERVVKIRSALLRGKSLETPLAVFFLDT